MTTSAFAAPEGAMRVLASLRGGCCYGSAEYGPTGCTCWAPVFDIEQDEVLVGIDAVTRDQMCKDCAYRPNSPERAGSKLQVCSGEGELDDLARGGQPFWCHQGMRRHIAWEHPAGIRITAEPATTGVSYDPPIEDGIPYKADGTPGDRCAGWSARRDQLAAAEGWLP